MLDRSRQDAHEADRADLRGDAVLAVGLRRVSHQRGLPHNFPQVTIRIREIPGITAWLILCLVWHCPARGISAFQDGVYVLFAGGEITQDALR